MSRVTSGLGSLVTPRIVREGRKGLATRMPVEESVWMKVQRAHDHALLKCGVSQLCL